VLRSSFLMILLDFKQNSIWSTESRKRFRYKILQKSIQWEQDCFMRTDRHDEARTDAPELTVDTSSRPGATPVWPKSEQNMDTHIYSYYERVQLKYKLQHTAVALI
jgi:hypothetical protein